MENTTSIDVFDNATFQEADPVLKTTLDVLLIVVMAVVMFSLGCTIEFAVLKTELRRPVGIGIGMFCQFILFPMIAFGLAHALQLKSYDALGMVMLGTCPGGSISNIATFWSSGDVALSVSMTAASTAIGTGMMPLNMWIYTRSWTNQAAVIPFVSIVIALVSILVPVAIGMAIRVKFPKISKWMARAGSVVGMLVIIGILVVKLSCIQMYTQLTQHGLYGLDLQSFHFSAY